MLTIKQEKFVQNLIKGMTQREAYKHSYDAKNMKDETIDNKASKLFKEHEIRARYDELVETLKDEAIMSAKERMIWLTKIVNGEILEDVPVMTDIKEDKVNTVKCPTKIDTKIKALDTLNKMDNSYQQNINIKGTVNNPYANLSEEELRKLAGDS